MPDEIAPQNYLCRIAPPSFITGFADYNLNHDWGDSSTQMTVGRAVGRVLSNFWPLVER